jgi:carboxyl-terminal processing protease
MRRIVILLPLLCGVMLALGLWLGVKLGSGGSYTASAGPMNKVRAVLDFVDAHYVDTVDANRLADMTVEALLSQLDPHSGYESAEELRALNEPLEGKFEGIGIEYNILRDSLTVVAVVPGGPSEKAGLQAGDRLVRASGGSLTGPNGVKDGNIRKLLRGAAGSTVKIELVRRGAPGLLAYNVTRGSIPIRSVDVAYMLDAQTGYIRLLRFADKSREELVVASTQLKQRGMKRLVLDLRGNGGGFLHAAVEICDEFLGNGKMIVYTQGRTDGRHDYKATAEGSLEQMPLAILIDQHSASASEVVAGAIQDNDRGLVIGRRSFGKGLVQQPQTLADGSGFRLTIARYYTPTGRCIQKPYTEGDEEGYAADDNNRFRNGELLSADSIHFADSLKFKTPGGKIVYGGGGIMPDVFVPIDTSKRSLWLSEMVFDNLFTLFALDYATKHKAELLKTGREEFVKSFTITPAITDAFFATAKAKRNAAEEQRVKAQFHRYIKSYIGRVIWNDEGFYPVWNEADPVIEAALKAFK